MKASIIGIVSGIVTILIFVILKRIDKNVIYGMILACIGFIYVGFTWSDFGQLSVTVLQAIFFLFLAYYGIKKNSYVLIAGYFLHGIWDLIYSFATNSSLMPPDYDLFCLTIDFVIGFYLLYLNHRSGLKGNV
jgi:hypothetical protein